MNLFNGFICILKTFEEYLNWILPLKLVANYFYFIINYAIIK